MNPVTTATKARQLGQIFSLGLLISFGTGAPLMANDALSDPSNIMGPDECRECHKPEARVWRETKHSQTFKVLPRKKEAREISGKMGIKRMKKDSACVTCHFTVGIKKGKEKAIAGISCESCHGPSKNWIKVHGDFGGKKITKEMEDPAHKTQRLAKMKASGMIRPATLYRLAKNCYECHSVPNEKLVNVGGHTPGSKFELVSWSQGEVRHNFHGSKKKKNEEAVPERKRMLYLIGMALDLEYSLRALAKATEDGKFSVAMTTRIQGATGKLKQIQQLASPPGIKEILSAVAPLKLIPNNELNLTTAADTITISTQQLAEKLDSSTLTALDQLVPPADQYKGKPGTGEPRD